MVVNRCSCLLIDFGDSVIVNVVDNLINGWFCIYFGFVFDRISIQLCY